MEALARPYTQQHTAPEGHEFEGDVFFDSQELEVLELPEHASPHLVQVLASDAADLYTAVQAEQDEEEPLATPQPGQPAPVGGRRRGSGRVRVLARVDHLDVFTPASQTKAKLKATLRRAQDDWNTQFEEWSKCVAPITCVVCTRVCCSCTGFGTATSSTLQYLGWPSLLIA